jgi:predicted site-specific integrase-resolvase
MSAKLKTIKEVSSTIGLSVPAIRKQIKQGKIQVQQGCKGGIVFIPESEVNRLKERYNPTDESKPNITDDNVVIPRSFFERMFN